MTQSLNIYTLIASLIKKLKIKLKRKWIWLLFLSIMIFITGGGVIFWAQHKKNAITNCYRRANTFREQGKLFSALREFDKAMELGADRADCLGYRGMCEQAFGHLSAAKSIKKPL